MNAIEAPRALAKKRKWILGLLVAASISTITACSDSDSSAAIDGDNVNIDDDAITDDNANTDDGNNNFVPVVDPNDVVPEPSEESIINSLLDNVDFGTLLGLVLQADLADTLDNNNGGNGWTLFAFSDNASGADEVFGLTGDEANALVGGHLFSGRLLLEDIQPGGLTMTRGSVNVTVNDDGTISVGGARIVARDREFSNGVIHFVDSVLETF